MDSDKKPIEDLTILEYLKERVSSVRDVSDKKGTEAEKVPGLETINLEEKSAVRSRFLLTFGVVFILTGQYLLNLRSENYYVFAICTFIIGGVLTLHNASKAQEFVKVTKTIRQLISPLQIEWLWAMVSLVMSSLSFLLFGGGKFTFLSTFSWICAILSATYAFWQKEKKSFKLDILKTIRSHVQSNWQFFLLATSLCGLIVFSSFFRLGELPPEIISSQVESYYSVKEILEGNTYLFFPRNVIGEPASYYWASGIIKLSSEPVSIYGMQAAFAVASIIASISLFLLGSLLFNKYVGLLAAFLLGVGFWPSLQVRALIGGGLVLPIMILEFYFMILFLTRAKPNYLLVASLFAGLGLLTNKIFLILPILNSLVLLIWTLRRAKVKYSRHYWTAAMAGLAISLIVSIPLLRFVIQNPGNYFRPIFSRITELEADITGSAVVVFLTNEIRALGIVNWINRSSWVDAIPGKSAVDLVTSTFFVIGFLQLMIRFIKQRQQLDLVVLISFPVLLIPSAMSLAFPSENPSLTRAIGSAIPVMLIAAFGLYNVLSSLIILNSKSLKWLKPAILFTCCLVIWYLNYGLIFNNYSENFRKSSWNSSEIANVIKNYGQNQTENLNTWIVGYPYWVDARAVAIYSGISDKDLSLTSDLIPQTREIDGPKLFFLHPEAAEELNLLKLMFPDGSISVFESTLPAKDFIAYYVSY